MLTWKKTEDEVGRQWFADTPKGEVMVSEDAGKTILTIPIVTDGETEAEQDIPFANFNDAVNFANNLP